MSVLNRSAASVPHATRLGALAAGAAALMLAGCQGPYLTEQAFYEDAPPRALGGEEIRAALVGNSVVSDAPDGPFRVYFPDEEQILGQHSRHYRDSGRWRVTEEGMCARWENWWGNVERCWQVMLDGETVTWLDPYGEATAGEVSIVPGNVAGL